jgi:superfamily II DNA or RNA helicase
VQPRLDIEPVATGAAAVYPYSEKIAEQFVAVSRFDDPYPMHRVFENEGSKYIAVPRNLAPMGETDVRDWGEAYPFVSSFEPRSAEQSRVISRSTGRLLKGESFITQAPTGFGKTWCAMEVIARIGVRTLVVVTKEDLRDEWEKVAKTLLGVEAGFIQGNRIDTGCALTIGLVQSLSNFNRYPPATFKGIGLTIFDEVHRVAADHFSNTCWILPSLLRWGLSATPKRQDGKEDLIEASIGPVRVVTHQATLTPIVYRAKTDVQFPRMTQRPGRMGHFERILAGNMRRNHFIARFVSTCYKRQRHIIIFATTKKHLGNLHDAIKKVGIPAKDMAYYIGGLTKQERLVAMEKRVILATYAYTAEATNIPWLDTLVMATPRSDVVQIVGRILREYEGKKTPAILDLEDPLRMWGNYASKREEFYQSIGSDIRQVSYE